MSQQKQRILSRGQVSIAAEADYIIGRAQEQDCRIVSLNGIVFFSTETGDAWMIDPQDRLAICLARNGEQQNYAIVETASNFQIAWDAQYHIDRDTFVVVTKEGRARSIWGYPIKAIEEAISKMR